MKDDVLELAQQITEHGIRALKTHINETDLPIDYVAIFAKSEEEYNTLTKQIEKLGEKVEETSTGFTYKLETPLETDAGKLHLIKIRKYDPEKLQRGAPDFRIKDYQDFKNKHLNKDCMNLIEREDYEMLELIDDQILVYLPNKPLSVELGIN